MIVLYSSLFIFSFALCIEASVIGNVRIFHISDFQKVDILLCTKLSPVEHQQKFDERLMIDIDIKP